MPLLILILLLLAASASAQAVRPVPVVDSTAPFATPVPVELIKPLEETPPEIKIPETCSPPLLCLPAGVTSFSACERVEGPACPASTDGLPLACIHCNPTAFQNLRSRLSVLGPDARARIEAKIATLPEETQAYFKEQLLVPMRPQLNVEAGMEAVAEDGQRVPLKAALMKIVKRTGYKWHVTVPMQLRAGKRLNRLADANHQVEYETGRWRLAIKDAEGKHTGQIVAHVSEMVGNGDSADGDVEKLELITDVKKHAVSEEGGKVHRVAAYVDAELNELPEGGSVALKPKEGVAADVKQKLREVARKQKLELREEGAVVEVAKEGLRNQQHIKRAKMVLKIENAWVKARGGPRFVRVMRQSDEGEVQVLPTKYAGVDKEGFATFEGESAEGLSVFALYSVKYLEPEPTAAPAETQAVTTPTPTPQPTLRATTPSAAGPVVGAGVDYFTIGLAVLVVGLVAYVVFSSVAKGRGVQKKATHPHNGEHAKKK